MKADFFEKNIGLVSRVLETNIIDLRMLGTNSKQKLEPAYLFKSMRCIYLPKLHVNEMTNEVISEDDVDSIEDFLYFSYPNQSIFA